MSVTIRKCKRNMNEKCILLGFPIPTTTLDTRGWIYNLKKNKIHYFLLPYICFFGELKSFLNSNLQSFVTSRMNINMKLINVCFKTFFQSTISSLKPWFCFTQLMRRFVWSRYNRSICFVLFWKLKQHLQPKTYKSQNYPKFIFI